MSCEVMGRSRRHVVWAAAEKRECRSKRERVLIVRVHILFSTAVHSLTSIWPHTLIHYSSAQSDKYRQPVCFSRCNVSERKVPPQFELQKVDCVVNGQEWPQHYRSATRRLNSLWSHRVCTQHQSPALCRASSYKMHESHDRCFVPEDKESVGIQKHSAQTQVFSYVEVLLRASQWLTWIRSVLVPV